MTAKEAEKVYFAKSVDESSLDEDGLPCTLLLFLLYITDDLIFL
jgi:hypothetical protein